MLGVDPLIATTQKPRPAINACLFMVCVMPIVATVTYIFNFYLLSQFIPGYLHLIATVMLITITVMVSGFITQRYFSSIFNKIEKIIPLILVNSTLLGLVLIGNNYIYSIFTAFFFGLGTALGFSLLLMMTVSIRKKLDNPEIPRPLRGVAILFITLGILSMGFMGFSGITLTR